MKAITDAEFYRLTTFVREHYGINLEKKRTLIESRLSFDLEQGGYSGYAAYLRKVMDNPSGQECQHMLNRLSTNYTFFFREPRSFEYLVRQALPAYQFSEEKKLNFWCAACSSGEEAYSLAMTLNRYLLPSGKPLSYQLLATDLNTEVLATAKLGVYPLKSWDTIPAECRRFFHRSKDSLTVCSAVREKVSFQAENLLTCTRQECMDMIFCRNVMIYFKPEMRERLTKTLWTALKPGGYLFISGTESIDLTNKLFKRMEPAIYRKREAGKL